MCFVPLAILMTLITLKIVGFMGRNSSDSSSSRTMPTIERKTMTTSSWFHLSLRYRSNPRAVTFAADSRMKTTVKK